MTNFYITRTALKKINLNYLFYTKYYLLFYSDQLVPVQIINLEEEPDAFSTLEKPWILTDHSQAETLKQAEFERVIQINDNVSLGVNNE